MIDCLLNTKRTFTELFVHCFTPHVWLVLTPMFQRCVFLGISWFGIDPTRGSSPPRGCTEWARTPQKRHSPGVLGWSYVLGKQQFAREHDLVGGEGLPWIWHFPMNIGLRWSSQLTHIFQRGGEKPPTSDPFCSWFTHEDADVPYPGEFTRGPIDTWYLFPAKIRAGQFLPCWIHGLL